QAEDGIRDFHVTGVQSVLFRSVEERRLAGVGVADERNDGLRSALAVLALLAAARDNGLQVLFDTRNALFQGAPVRLDLCFTGARSEERRVGKEGRSRRAHRSST